MKFYDELKVEMEVIQQQIVKVNKNEHTNELKEVNRLYKDFGFLAMILMGALVEGRNKK